MASVMVKVAGEGLVSKAHRNSDSGPTSGSSVIYEVIGVPDGIAEGDVIEAIKKVANSVPHNDSYEVEYAALVG